jgi:hypothetical protein
MASDPTTPWGCTAFGGFLLLATANALGRLLALAILAFGALWLGDYYGWWHLYLHLGPVTIFHLRLGPMTLPPAGG